jgi:hypothetical protein
VVNARRWGKGYSPNLVNTCPYGQAGGEHLPTYVPPPPPPTGKHVVLKSYDLHTHASVHTPSDDCNTLPQTFPVGGVYVSWQMLAHSLPRGAGINQIWLMPLPSVQAGGEHLANLVPPHHTTLACKHKTFACKNKTFACKMRHPTAIPTPGLLSIDMLSAQAQTLCCVVASVHVHE